jgi:hypothetical protein
VAAKRISMVVLPRKIGNKGRLAPLVEIRS